jgi:hypothetical protein
MKRLKTAAQARAEGLRCDTGQQCAWTAGGSYVEDVETERETYWADRCEAAEAHLLKIAQDVSAIMPAPTIVLGKDEAVQLLAQRLEAAERSACNWVALKDATPPLNTEVLVWAPGTWRLTCASLNEFGTWSRRWALDEADLPFDTVTHWALPLLPDGTVPRG